MSISVRSNKSRSWYVADVRFAGSKIYLGMYDFDAQGLEDAQQVIESAKQIIQRVKLEVKEMSNPMKEQRFVELKWTLREQATVAAE